MVQDHEGIPIKGYLYELRLYLVNFREYEAGRLYGTAEVIRQCTSTDMRHY